jgi:hypothetical protein
MTVLFFTEHNNLKNDKAQRELPAYPETILVQKIPTEIVQTNTNSDELPLMLLRQNKNENSSKSWHVGFRAAFLTRQSTAASHRLSSC